MQELEIPYGIHIQAEEEYLLRKYEAVRSVYANAEIETTVDEWLAGLSDDVKRAMDVYSSRMKELDKMYELLFRLDEFEEEHVAVELAERWKKFQETKI